MRVDDPGVSPDLRLKFRHIPRAQGQEYVIEKRKGWGVDLLSLHVIQEEVPDEPVEMVSASGIAFDDLVLDGNTMKEFEEVFLCGTTLKEMKKILKIKTVRVNRGGGEGFIRILSAGKTAKRRR